MPCSRSGTAGAIAKLAKAGTLHCGQAALVHKGLLAGIATSLGKLAQP
jgi:hypothetical protein